MDSGSLSRRYAGALVSLCKEHDCLEQVLGDLETFDQVLDLGDAVLRQALQNPGLSTHDRREILAAVLAKLDLHAYSKNFLGLLLDKGRFGYLDGIRSKLGEMADELAGRVRATVVTAKPLDKPMADEVVSSLSKATGKDVLAVFEVDPALIGGMVARVGDLVYDASVRARLEELQQALIRDPGAPVGTS